MAKRRKKSSGKKKSHRRRGLRGMADGSPMKKSLLFLTSVAAANLVDEGIEMLYATDFMKVTVPAATAANPTPAAPKINLKKAGASGGLVALSGLGVAMVKNEWVGAIATGAGIMASKYFKEDLVKPALGMGEVSDFLNLYKRDLKGVQLAGDRVNLAGDQLSLA